MARKYTDHSGSTVGNWKLVNRVPNAHNVHLYKVKCKECDTERELSFQRLTSGNVPCKPCASQKHVGTSAGLTIIMLEDRAELYPRRTPEDLVRLIPQADQAFLQHARVFYGIGRALLPVPNPFVFDALPVGSLVDAEATAQVLAKPEGDCLEVMQDQLGYFDLGPEMQTMPPDYIDTWVTTHQRGTTYMQTPSKKPGWVWVRALRVAAVEDEDWEDLPKREVDKFK